MRLLFPNATVRAACQSGAQMTRLWGPKAKEVQHCLLVLNAAPVLGHVTTFRSLTLERLAAGVHALTSAGPLWTLRHRSAQLVLATAVVPRLDDAERRADQCEILVVECSGIACGTSVAAS